MKNVITLEDARDHVSDVRDLDALAHAVASAVLDHPRTSKTRRLVQEYAKLRARVEAFRERLASKSGSEQ